MSGHAVQALVDLLGDEGLDAHLRTAMFIAEDATMFEKLAAAERYFGMDADELAEAGAIGYQSRPRRRKLITAR